MARKKRTKPQIKADQKIIADLYLKAWTQQDIADHINELRPYNLTRQMISYDLKKIFKAWKESTLLDFNEAKARELSRIDKLEREYWKAWERSLEDIETLRQEGKVEEGSKPERVVRNVKEQGGDPRYLSGIQWCITQRCKILGINAALKTRNENVDLTALSDDQLTRLANGEDLFDILADPG
jgi:hypothetical protein